MTTPRRVPRVADDVSDAIRYATALRGVVVWSGTGAGRQRGGSSAIARSRHESVHDAHGSRPSAGQGEVHGSSFDVLSVPFRDGGASARRREDPQNGSAAGAGRSRRPSGGERAHGARRPAGNLHIGVEHRHRHLLSCGWTRWRTGGVPIKRVSRCPRRGLEHHPCRAVVGQGRAPEEPRATLTTTPESHKRSDELRSYVDEQVGDGGYGSTSEYVRDLIRRDKDRQLLRRVLLDGAASSPGPVADAAYFMSLRDRIRSDA